MHRFLHFLVLALLALPTVAQTRLDPGFLAQTIHSSGVYAEQALQLADGSRILVGGFRANGYVNRNGLVKYLPSGQLDAAFNAQVAQYSFWASSVAEAPGNKLVVGLYGPGTFGTQMHYGLVRLLATGALDTSFTPQPASASFYSGSSINVFLVQADGKIVVANELALALSSPSRILARLNTDGTPDTAFGAQLSTGFSDPGGTSGASVGGICQQPDGKLLVSGALKLSTQAAFLTNRLLRLLPSGAADASFSYSGPLTAQTSIALQPDGKVLITAPTFSNGVLLRLLPSGIMDTSFQSPLNLTTDLPRVSNPSVIQVQTDGRILVASVRELTATQLNASSFVVRLLATGALDASWQPPMYGDYGAVASRIQLLPNGQVLVAGSAKLYASATALPTPVGLLDATGAYVPSFAPVLQAEGLILSMALQTDGRIVVVGDFDEINGVPARNVARLYPDGTVDASFTANGAAPGGVVSAVLVQPDGKILLGGRFISAGGQAQSGVARLLPSGLADPGFASGLSPNTAFHVQQATHLALQPNGQVLASGTLLPAGATQGLSLLRLAATGQWDTTFQPAVVGYDSNYRYPLLAQPDGKIITANMVPPNSSGTMAYESVTRLLPNGSLDPSFIRVPTVGGGGAQIWQLEQYPDGRLLAGGKINSYGATPAGGLIRLLATGAPDATFTSTIASFIVGATAIQPNGRVLAAGATYAGATNPPFIRLLSDGSFDASFTRTQGPAVGSQVYKLLVQPDGGILVAGNFDTVGGQPRMGIVRLLDGNVLSVASTQTQALTTAWPVPAHDALHLALDAAARPQQVQLLDALGRVVLTQPASQSALTLSTTGLPTGMYLLRVRYATGDVTRRVVLE
jgi:uncharacterized delta-60 repeat protein